MCKKIKKVLLLFYFFINTIIFGSDVDADPNPDLDWIRIQLGPWIRVKIRIANPDPDPGGQKEPTNMKKVNNFKILKFLMFSFEG